MYPVDANKAQRFRLGQTASSPASISSLDSVRQGDWSPQFSPVNQSDEPSLMGHSLLSPVRCSAIFRECHMNSYEFRLHIHVADVHLPWYSPAARRLNCCAKYSCGLMSCTSMGFHQLENHENVGKTMPFWPAMTGKGKIYTTYWNGGLGGDWGMVYEIVLPTLWYIMVYSDCWVSRLHQVSAGSFSKMLATALPRIRIVTVTKVFRNEVLAIWTYMDLYAVQSGSI